MRPRIAPVVAFCASAGTPNSDNNSRARDEARAGAQCGWRRDRMSVPSVVSIVIGRRRPRARERYRAAPTRCVVALSPLRHETAAGARGLLFATRVSPEKTFANPLIGISFADEQSQHLRRIRVCPAASLS